MSAPQFLGSDGEMNCGAARAYRTRGTYWQQVRPSWQWVIAVDVPNYSAMGNLKGALTGPAVVDDFGNLVAVGGMQ